MTDTACPPLHGVKACEAISGTMISHFVTRLELEAHRAGGTLTAEQIRALAEHFISQEMPHFQMVLQKSWDRCSEARQEKQWENARNRPFDRILMKSFAHLFPPRQGDDGGRGILSRRMIPGFHMAVDKMIGPALYDQCQRIAQIILDRHRTADGHLDWPAIYRDPDTLALTSDVVVVFAHYFTHFERRREWFLTLINSHLTPVASNSADGHWVLTEHGFDELMRALFHDLHSALSSQRPQIARRYGASTVDAIEFFFHQLRL